MLTSVPLYLLRNHGAFLPPKLFPQQLNAELRMHIDGVIAVSRPVMPGELTGRSVPVRLRDSVAYLLSPYM